MTKLNKLIHLFWSKEATGKQKKPNCLLRVTNEYKLDHNSDKGIYFLHFLKGNEGLPRPIKSRVHSH